MKIYLVLCAASAVAVQDITPPVMSITLPTSVGVGNASYTTSTQNGAFSSGEHVAAPRANGFVRDGETVVCEVGDHANDVQACPEPTCEAYDHHDGDLGACDKKYIMVNDDNTVLDQDGKDYEFTSIHRTLRSEWLIEFDAEDKSGNKAQTMTFTMVFRDTLAPTLTTEFGESQLWQQHYMTDDKYFRASDDSRPAVSAYTALSWAESCSECPSYSSAVQASAGNCSAPCTRSLSTSHTSIDKYDGDVKANTLVQIIKPDQSVHLAPTNLDGINPDVLTIDTSVVGTWTVSYMASDNAGEFGYNELPNNGTQKVHIEVSDNTAPDVVLTPHGTSAICGSSSCVTAQTTNTLELQCNKTSEYSEPGAKCHDARASWTGTAWVDIDAGESGADMSVQGARIATTDSGNVHTILYDCTDGFSTSQANRTVTIVDTLAPTLMLHGDRSIQTSSGYHEHYIQNSAGEYHNHTNETTGESLKSKFEKTGGLDMTMLGSLHGATCIDSCSATANTQITAELFKGKTCDGESLGDINNFPEYVAGDYSIKYTCYDGSGTVSSDQVTYTKGDEREPLTAEKCRYIDNVDHTRPIIQILGSDVMQLEASHQGNYVDDGAVCSDQVDGVISQNVEVSGDVVNLSKVGTYEIVYNCKDSAGNVADEATRTVHIVQTSCPKCTITGCTGSSCTMAHEASFPYTDLGAVCSDEIDGNVAEEVTNNVNVELTGDYEVTYRTRNSVGLWNDGTNCRDGPQHYVRTVQVRDTLKPIIVVKYNNVEVARGTATDKAVHNASLSNPAATHTFMAQRKASGNTAWLAGSAAAAVFGLALLAYGRRTQAAISVAHAVPV